MNFTQDWTPVVFQKKAPKDNDKNAVKAALRSGTAETMCKLGNREYCDRARKLESDLDPSKDISNVKQAPLNKLSLASRQEMTRVRTEKKITQAQLAVQMNVRPNVVGDLEAGKPVQDASVLVKVNRILGTKLKFEK